MCRAWDHQRSDKIASRATGDVIAARICVDCIARALPRHLDDVWRWDLLGKCGDWITKEAMRSPRATGDGIASITTGDGIATRVCGDGITKKRSPREQLICVECIA